MSQLTVYFLHLKFWTRYRPVPLQFVELIMARQTSSSVTSGWWHDGWIRGNLLSLHTNILLLLLLKAVLSGRWFQDWGWPSSGKSCVLQQRQHSKNIFHGSHRSLTPLTCKRYIGMQSKRSRIIDLRLNFGVTKDAYSIPKNKTHFRRFYTRFLGFVLMSDGEVQCFG